MKNKRQEKILEIIRQNNVETQAELMELLEKEGFSATQATLSRDIRNLRLVKVHEADGRYRYACPDPEVPRVSDKFHSIFSDAVVGIEYACNIVVVKCLDGMAMAVCAAMDSLEWKEIVGTLSGDDTFICIAKNEQDASDLCEKLRDLRK